MTMEYDAIVIGGGPGGLTAGLYLARAGKKVICLEKGMLGGQMATTAHLENYPGFPKGISGREITALFEEQAREFGLEIMPGTVDGLTLDGPIKEVSVGGFPFRAPVVVVATGIIQKLGVPGEEEYLGRGVSYCATCDGALYRGRNVIGVGSTDWAIEEALYLSKFAGKLMLVIRPPALKPSDPAREELLKCPALEVVGSAKPVEILGDSRGVTGLSVDIGGAVRTLEADGVFIFTGKRMPGTAFLKGVVDLSPEGYVVAGDNCESSVPGIYAVGDVRRDRFHQVALAVGDGAVAGMDALRHLRKE